MVFAVAFGPWNLPGLVIDVLLRNLRRVCELCVLVFPLLDHPPHERSELRHRPLASRDVRKRC